MLLALSLAFDLLVGFSTLTSHFTPIEETITMVKTRCLDSQWLKNQVMGTFVYSIEKWCN